MQKIFERQSESAASVIESARSNIEIKLNGTHVILPLRHLAEDLAEYLAHVEWTTVSAVIDRAIAALAESREFAEFWFLRMVKYEA